jgi:hypothetical protein
MSHERTIEVSVADYVELVMRREAIPFEVVNDPSKQVSCNVVGKLGPFTIDRSGYWRVDGPVPIEVARRLYEADEDHVIRVAGHCMAPPPEDPWVVWHDDDGKTLEADPDGSIEKQATHFTNRFGLDFSHIRFVRSLDEVPNKRGFVMSYHIDTEDGLHLFIRTVREAGLA